MTRTLSIGISTCPNDTFAFHALLEREVRAQAIDLRFELADVEQLNEGLLAGRFDVAKASAHVLLAASERLVALPCGWALGMGVGPLVLAARGRRERPEPLVLAPGRWTTATLLWKLFHPEKVHLEQRLFSAILPALASAKADLGVCIHEARFTWKEWQVDFVEDLGETWERATQAPLPLGGLVASRALEPGVLQRVASAVRSSLEWGLAHRDRCLATMRRYAEASSDDVLWAHADLYVNERTLELGSIGRDALRTLGELARERGLLVGAAPEVLAI